MERPEYVPGTEIGSLTAHSNEDSQFVGSSSGVYFINTVKRAFSNGLDTSRSLETEFPTAEDTLVGAEDSPRLKRRRATPSRANSASSPRAGGYSTEVAAYLGNAPPLDLAKELMMAYFKVWHPLFPFLHGPTFLQAMESFYSSTLEEPSSEDTSPDHRRTCWTVIFQCIFNLGAFLRPDLELSPECRIHSPGSMTALLGNFSTRHDIASLQALLAVQVYLVATMSLRLASTFGGCVLRSMLHAGLHRCPFRYAQLSSHDRQLRKRIFWCAYAIDRYLSQALGLPLGIQDSDIDVCLPAAPEMHFPACGKNLSAKRSTSGSTTADFEPEHLIGCSDNTEHCHGLVATSHKSDEAEHCLKESVLASYVASGTLTGRALELFHKSILVRSIRRSAVLFLVTDVHKWWNSLPLDLQGQSAVANKEAASSDTDSPFDFGPFFTVLYQHLILIIHRPSLSLDPATAEFCSGLQTCISAARAILAALRTQVDRQQAFFWPGFLSAAWMSGLVLAFSCQLKQYVLTKGLQEIDECSSFLRRMSTQWETARHCCMTLSVLSAKIKQMEINPDAAATSHAYALRNMERENDFLDTSDLNVQSKRKSHSHSTIPADRPRPIMAETIENSGYGHRGPGFDPVSVRSQHSTNFNEEPLPAETPPSQTLDFQDTTPNYSTLGPSFDLNMVDLLGGADFDSLLDIVGQRYPSF
ncbi:uncharacterized protein N7482_008242 [Penicillium canariense]|uniref:Xylanolytic transcriptional activator regulatory domain-containing protein n=1 Tax=Penicillium canariense TaxID=189055 RepID=A0A9W9HTI0_9EURO|nr:uncharacterized protein N7482_008242 [Penicillium canariense]KAJ5157142.1 hypothetical protein N7482_008242 [Penicillium canariense]